MSVDCGDLSLRHWSQSVITIIPDHLEEKLSRLKRRAHSFPCSMNELTTSRSPHADTFIMSKSVNMATIRITLK